MSQQRYVIVRDGRERAFDDPDEYRTIKQLLDEHGEDYQVLTE